MVLAFMDARSVKLLQKVNLKLMLGCTITHMESGHHGGQDMADTVLVFTDARSVKLLQKVNLMLMPGCTITPTEYGQHGTLDTTNGLALYGRKKREAEAISEADAEAKAYYLLNGVWPAWYSGYYCVNGWQWGYSAC